MFCVVCVHVLFEGVDGVLVFDVVCCTSCCGVFGGVDVSGGRVRGNWFRKE